MASLSANGPVVVRVTRTDRIADGRYFQTQQRDLSLHTNGKLLQRVIYRRDDGTSHNDGWKLYARGIKGDKAAKFRNRAVELGYTEV